MKFHPLLMAMLLPVMITGQTFKFRQYSEQDGLSSRYVYSINQDEKGYLLIGTSEGLYKFDGVRFQTYETEDSLASLHIECSTNLSDKSILFGHNNGDLTRFAGDSLHPIRLTSFFTSRVTGIAEEKEGSIWVSSQNNGLIHIDKQWRITHYANGLEEYSVYCIVPLHGVLWLGTDMGLVRAIPGDAGKISAALIGGFPLTAVNALISPDGESLIAGTEDAGLFEVHPTSSGAAFHTLTADGYDLSTFFVKEIRADKKGNLWISTNTNGLVQLGGRKEDRFQKSTLYHPGSNESGSSVRTSFLDRENNLWIGTIGNGLFRLEDNYFSTYVMDTAGDPTVYCVHENLDSLWIGLTGEIRITGKNPAQVSQVLGKEHQLPSSKITAIHVDDDGLPWIGTQDAGLWYYVRGKSRFQPLILSDDLLSRKINAILSDDSLLYVATDFGLYVLHDKKKTDHYTIESGLSGNVVRSLFQDGSNRIWIGSTSSGLNCLENGTIQSFPSPLSNSSFPVRCFVQDRDGHIWMGTEGAGLIQITGDTQLAFMKADGLYSDYCYSLVCDDNNQLWIGHRGAASIVDLRNQRVYVKTPGELGEVYFLENAVMRIPGGTLLFGTNSGLLRYDPELDARNTFEPVLNIQSITVSDTPYNPNLPISLQSGDYKIEIEFTGISLSDPEGVTYKFMLEGYDNDWSEFTTLNKAVYNHLPPGRYTFKVKAFNSDGAGGVTTRSIEIFIDRPFWQKWWFLILCILIIIGTIRFIIHRRERLFRENQEYLTRELDARTKEVVEQKELLEIKNKDITDSIHYARNIQTAILPHTEVLTSSFADAFVFYEPRDIVSGDFYWIEHIGSRTIIACADCTGHGVPGAFMSLIGSVLLKEIAHNPAFTGPDQILTELHKELFQLLNGKSKEFSLEDGMDITVMEYNSETNKVRFASANRPVLHCSRGIMNEIRGDRKAIGGGGSEFRNESFSLHEIQPLAGDTIYLFSDGITDQFGGTRGKKLKRSGLIDILNPIQSKSMKEQLNHVRAKFSEWKGALTQLDDVILIGIRF